MSLPRSLPSRPRRRRRRRRRVPFLPLAVLVLLLGAVRLVPNLLDRPAPPLPAGPSSSVDMEALTARLEKLAPELPQVKTILKNIEAYPVPLLELLLRNPETADFVKNYPKEWDRKPAETVEEAKKGTFPLLNQWDPRWGYAVYGDGPMALTGCGPTVLSMVVCGLTGDDSATPYAIAAYAEKAGYYVDGAGSSWDLMSAGCQQFGLSSRELPLSRSSMVNTLDQGQPIICSVGPGDFTTSGHFILLTGIEDGAFRVNDPNFKVNSEKLWDYDTLAPQICNLWAYSVA